MAYSDLIARLGLDTAAFERGMKKADTMVGKFKKGLNSLGGFVGVGGFAAVAREAINLGSRLDDTSKKLGVTTEFLQSFGFAARETGTGTEAAENGLQRFTRRLGEAQQGTGELLPVLKQYNIQLKNADGTMRSAGEVLRDYADAIKSAKNPQEQLRMTVKGMDQEGASLVNVLREGAEGLDQWTNKAREAGQVMDDELIKQLAEAENSMEQFGRRVTIVVGQLVGKFRQLGEAIGTAIGELIYGNAEDIEMDYFRGVAKKQLAGQDFGGGRSATKKRQEEIERLATELYEAEKARLEEARQKQEELRKQQDEAAKAESAKLIANKEAQEEGKKAYKELSKSAKSMASQLSGLISKERGAIQSKDTSKMTLRELANIGQFAPGVSISTANAGAAAREVIDLQRQAEQARKSGNQTGWADSFDTLNQQAEAKMEELFRSGALKSSEVSSDIVDKVAKENAGNEAKVLEAQLEQANAHLAEMENSLKGKFVNQ